MGSQVMVALRVKATPERAFAVFTDGISVWWKPNAMFQFTPGAPGVLAFEGQEGGRLVERRPDGKVFEIGEIRVWSPGERLVFGWRQATFTPDQDTQVEVSFTPVGEETRVTVVHTGWDSVPARHAARHGMQGAYFLQRHGEYWRALLGSFGEQVQ